jgi:hypothetical protein
MPIQVKVGGDTVVFPDGTSDDDIKSALDKEYGQGAQPEETRPPAPEA